jgi:hypothetical protein
MDKQFSAYTYDLDLLAEIEMTTNLMITASVTPGRLTSDAIDDALGLAPPRPARPPRASRSVRPRRIGRRHISKTPDPRPRP